MEQREHKSEKRERQRREIQKRKQERRSGLARRERKTNGGRRESLREIRKELTFPSLPLLQASDPSSSFAGRWAAKEAVVKALSSSDVSDTSRNLWAGGGGGKERDRARGIEEEGREVKRGERKMRQKRTKGR